MKNSKVVSFLSPFKVGQAGNLWTLPRRVGFEVVFDIAEDEGLLGCEIGLLGDWLLEFLRPFEHLKHHYPLSLRHSITSCKT